jgi:uncharacterized protein YkwD
MRILAALAAALLLGTGLGSCESTEVDVREVREWVNRSRADAGLPPLQENLILNLKADRWAQGMRDACRIWHSELIDGAPPRWTKLGENVGMGGRIEQVHIAYMKSPGHRANILDPRFTQIGTAAVWGKCNGFDTVFTVQVFMAT